MLRRALDDDTLFFNTLRDYSNTFAFTTATTEQFANYIAGRVGDRSPIDLRDYIDEWIMTGGYPVYNITWASGSNGWLVIKIEQQQSGRSYSMPLRFTSNDATAGDAQNFMLVDTARSQIFKVKLPSKATALVMDTSAAVLTSFTVSYDVNLEALSVGQPNEAMTTIDRSSDGWIVSVADPVGGRMQLTDVLGKVVLAAPFTSGNGRIRIASNRLPHGVFWGRIENGAKISTFKIEN
jgi:aminopeptidase N